MVTFQELNDLRLGKLQAAVADWQAMVDKLVKVADGGNGEVSAADLGSKAKAAEWKGQNATVTKDFVTVTAREFDDVVTVARSVHTILSGAHSKLTKHKSDLADAVGRAAKKNIYVNEKGMVNAAVPSPQAAGSAKIEPPTQAEIDAVAKEISTILTAAGETDSTAATALRFHAKDKHGFESSGFNSFDSAQKSIEDSDELIALGKKDPSELTNEQLARFNALMKAHPDDPVFAERVALGLGPEGTLKFFAGAVNLDSWENREGGGTGTREAREERMQLLGTLEKQLGTTLATASHSNSEGMESWKDRVVALGGENVGGGQGGSQARVHGFQAMSNLMRHGKYEGEFLNDYGNALVKYEKENTGDVKDPGPGGKRREDVLPWDKLPSYAKVDQLHYGENNDAGTDPMTGFMKALAHNPDAATDFFSATDPQDNAQYLLKDRQPMNDVVPDSMGVGGRWMTTRARRRSTKRPATLSSRRRPESTRTTAPRGPSSTPDSTGRSSTIRWSTSRRGRRLPRRDAGRHGDRPDEPRGRGAPLRECAGRRPQGPAAAGPGPAPGSVQAGLPRPERVRHAQRGPEPRDRPGHPRGPSEGSQGDPATCG